MIRPTMLPPEELAAVIATVCFAAGLNVYATGATLGLLARADLVTLPEPIGALASTWIIGICLALFALELVADKIPVFDLIWNMLQTFVRVPAGALLAWSAAAQLSPAGQLLAALAGAAVALAAHGGKLAVRAAITPSPEPVTNIGLSLAEDVVAIGLTWFAVVHPFLAATIVLVLLLGLTLAAVWVVRALSRSLRRRSKVHPQSVG